MPTSHEERDDWIHREEQRFLNAPADIDDEWEEDEDEESEEEFINDSNENNVTTRTDK